MLNFKIWLDSFLPTISNDINKLVRKRLGSYGVGGGNELYSIGASRLGPAMPDYHAPSRDFNSNINTDDQYVIVNVKLNYDPTKNEGIDKLIHKARGIALADPGVKKNLEDTKASWYLSPKRTGIKDLQENGSYYKLFTFYFKKNSRPDIKQF